MIAWLAPGQGMELPGMGRDVAASWPVAAELLASVAPGLHGTEVVQPALTAVALGAAAVLRDRGVRCDLVAGHSVGELAAWAIAGGATAVEAIALAEVRGRAMAAAARENPGGLWAVPEEGLPDLPEGLQVAVENPGQIVLSGVGPPVAGARPVPTSGAWHSPAMASAVAPFAAALDQIPARRLAIRVVSNHDGQPTADDDRIREHLVAQLTHRVRWTAVLNALRLEGVRAVVLLGPGKVLAAQLCAYWPEVAVHRTDRARDLEATASALAVG